MNTETIDAKVAELIALKEHAYQLESRGKVEYAICAHADFEAALRKELQDAQPEVTHISWNDAGVRTVNGVL